MAASPYSIDPTNYLDELLAQASPDLMREMLQGFINQILSTQADQICGADYATTSESRTNVRHGYRHRDLDTHRFIFPAQVTRTTIRGRLSTNNRNRDLLFKGRIHTQDERSRCQFGNQ